MFFWLKQPDVAKMKAEDDIQGLIRTMGHKDYFVRLDAQKVLKKIGTPAVDPLINAMNDRNQSVRSGAIIVLGTIGDNRAVDPLIRILKNKNEKNEVKKSAENTLAEIGAIDPVIRVLDDEDPKVRIRIVNILRKINDPRAFSALNTAMNDKDPEVAHLATSALKSKENSLRIAAEEQKEIARPRECSTCGAWDESSLTLSYPCPECGYTYGIRDKDIDRRVGVQVMCPNCRKTVIVPPEVVCPTCGHFTKNADPTRLINQRNR